RSTCAVSGDRLSTAHSIAGAIMPAATAEALTPPGSITATRRPRRLSSAATHRPRAPAPMTTASKEGSGELERGTGCPSTSRAPISTVDGGVLFSSQLGRTRLFQTLGQGGVLVPQGLGQAIAELLIEGGDQSRFLGPDVCVDIQQDLQIGV